MKILGIDPGCRITGYSVLYKEGRSIRLVDTGYLSLPASQSLITRVGLFHNFVEQKIDQWMIDHIALEIPFLGKNAQSFLKLGYLRGVVYLITDQRKLQLLEYKPTEVKQAVTGYGGAQKDQISRVMLQLFPQLQVPSKFDVTDAIAIALCGAWRGKGN